MYRLRESHPSLKRLAREVTAAYFDTNPTDPTLEHVDVMAFNHWAESGKPIWEWNNEALSFMLRRKYDLGTRGYSPKPFDPNEPRF